MAKKAKPEEKLPVLEDKPTQQLTNQNKTIKNVARHNSTNIPRPRPIRLPRIDGSLDRLKSRKVALPQAHRIIESLDVENGRTNMSIHELRPNAYDDTVIRPPQRSSNQQSSLGEMPKITVKKTATLPPQPKPKDKPHLHSDVTTLLRTYKKYGSTISSGTSTLPMRQNIFDRNDQRRTRLITLFNDK